MEDRSRWPAIGYEDVRWHRSVDEFESVPRSYRRRMSAAYQAAIPLDIASRRLKLPAALESRMADAAAAAARFDERQAKAGIRLPAMLLRSESAASSQIENLTSSARNIALAEVSGSAPRNAQIVAGNVAAMRQALSVEGDLTEGLIARIHAALLASDARGFAGRFREEQVWIGGSPYSPHDALFVPPIAARISGCLADLVQFSVRDDVSSVGKAAILHAQFETIHPFIDGNGRTGRALLARSLKQDGIVRSATLPVSAGLLHDVEGYMDALSAYHEGDVAAIAECVTDAVELAVSMGELASQRIEEVVGQWREAITQRKGSAIHEMPALLVEQPVVTSAFVAGQLGLSDRAARDAIQLACDYGMVRQAGNYRRGRFYQADALLAIVEDIAAEDSLRRLRRR